MRPIPRYDALLVAIVAAACDSPSAPAGVRTPLGACDGAVTELPIEPGLHVPPGSEITSWGSNPPASGAHYPNWARWNRTYLDPPMPRGYWVHNLEHGGVAFLFHCPEGCPDDVAALERITFTLPPDPSCVPRWNRTLITADPLLPPGVRFAAAAWGATYTAGCVDEESLRTFANAHYDLAPESSCDDGDQPSP